MAPDTTSRHSTQSFLLLFCIVMAVSGFHGACAGELSDNPLPAIHVFSIAPQPLSTALLELSQAAKLKIFYDAKITRGINSPGLSGRYPSEQALIKLLEKTGIGYSLTASGSVKLHATKTGQAPAKGPIRQNQDPD